MSSITGANGRAQTEGKPLPLAPSRMNSTIRPVRKSFDDDEDDDEYDASSSQSAMSGAAAASRTSALSSNLRNKHISTAMPSSSPTNGSDKAVRLRQSPSPQPSSSHLSPPARSSARTSFEMTRSSLHYQLESSPAPSNNSLGFDGLSSYPSVQRSIDMVDSAGSSGWDSAIGKSGLGKTGRVINKLVSDNEALKRDIKIERLRAEESHQAARLLQDKMDRLVADYESRLLEANVTKTLLARKERQVDSLQATVELERQRAMTARERERTWKHEMEQARSEAAQQVEAATARAALMDGQYNAISGHWAGQRANVERALHDMSREIDALRDERRRDDDRITTLRDLCDQQDANIRDLRRQKEDIGRHFERYKLEQEEALRSIKTKARQREEEQERMIQETKETLNQLRWALNVKTMIPWAE